MVLSDLLAVVVISSIPSSELTGLVINKISSGVSVTLLEGIILPVLVLADADAMPVLKYVGDGMANVDVDDDINEEEDKGKYESIPPPTPSRSPSLGPTTVVVVVVLPAAVVSSSIGLSDDDLCCCCI